MKTCMCNLEERAGGESFSDLCEFFFLADWLVDWLAVWSFHHLSSNLALFYLNKLARWYQARRRHDGPRWSCLEF